MAVRALPFSFARAPLAATGVPPAVLALTLIAPALDLFFAVQPVPGLVFATSAASALAAAALLVSWIRFARTSWLFAACLAAIAGLAMRLVRAALGPVLSVLTVASL